MKKLFNAIFGDIQWKILSLLAALVLWFIGMNVYNPLQNTPVFRSLQLQNIDILARDNIVLLNQTELQATNIRIGVRALRLDSDNLDSNVSANIDFRAINPNDVFNGDSPVFLRMDVSVNMYNPHFEHTSIQPNFVYALLDRMDRVTMQILQEVDGQVEPGYEIQGITLANRNVTITGARSHITQIDSVMVHIDVSDVMVDMEKDVYIMIYDKENNNITELFDLSVSQTTASIRVLPIHAIPVEIETIGNLATGFAIADINWGQPLNLNIVASPSRIVEIDEIRIALDLTGRSSSFTEHIPLAQWLPVGANLSEDEIQNITVTVTVEPIQERVFFIHIDDIRARAFGSVYDVIDGTTNIRVNVSGPQSIIAELTAADIGLELDLRNRAIGTHRIPLIVNLPQGVTLAQAVPALQIQIFAPAIADNNNEDDFVVPPTPEPSPEPTPMPEPTPTPEPTTTPEPTPEPTPQPTTTPEPTATPEPSPTPSPSPHVPPLPTTTPEPIPSPEPLEPDYYANNNNLEDDPPPQHSDIPPTDYSYVGESEDI